MQDAILLWKGLNTHPNVGAEAGQMAVRLGATRTPSAGQFGPGVSLDIAGRFPG